MNNIREKYMEILIGYTGFVGSNLHNQHEFEGIFNSKNIKDAFDLNPEVCVYAGVRAEKFLANNDPKCDMAVIENTIENIKRINPKRLILISTIDVFKTPYDCDENTPVEVHGLHAYGYNRYRLEKWCGENIKNCHILRLPGLFGKNIKKNFIYDLIHVLPSALNEAKFSEFSAKESMIKSCYVKQNKGFYNLQTISCIERTALLDAFARLNFSALNFTDSRAVFQLYNLSYLWEHIEFAIKNDIRLLHLAVEPISACELYLTVRGNVFVNEITDKPPLYDFRTIYYNELGGGNGYIFNKMRVMREVKEYIASSI